MQNIVIHKAETRGYANHKWLEAYHTFSFSDYHNPERMHFGVLRVLNDDKIEAGMGFGMHPHSNMEIITIPLEGELEHKDSMGNMGSIKPGEVQVMSAGTGIQHSEYNKSKSEVLKLLQIWVLPNTKNVTPRYDQITLNPNHPHNKLQQILSPNKNDEGVWIHQDAWFHLGKFTIDFSSNYKIKRKENGVYIFVIKGNLFVDNNLLNPRDGMGTWGIEQINLKSASANTEFLIMDVPMNL